MQPSTSPGQGSRIRPAPLGCRAVWQLSYESVCDDEGLDPMKFCMKEVQNLKEISNDQMWWRIPPNWFSEAVEQSYQSMNSECDVHLGGYRVWEVHVDMDDMLQVSDKGEARKMQQVLVQVD